MENASIPQNSSFRVIVEKQKSFRGLMEKQKSFRIAMEKQLSFGRERKRAKESPGKRGDSELHLAARAGNLAKIREVFQDFDANVIRNVLSKQNHDGETALYAASENGHGTMVSELLKVYDLESASIPAKNGYDPFHIAAKHGHLNVLKELLHSFPNLAMTADSSNSTALHTAATRGHIEVVNLILETDSDLSKIAKNNGKTALHSASRIGYLDVVKSLLDKDPSSCLRTDKKGQSALHMAVKGQKVEIVLELLKTDPSVVNMEDNMGNTALHVAVKKGRLQMVRCLLSANGINLNHMNKSGNSPLDHAEKIKHDEIAIILREAGALHSQDCGQRPNAAKQLKQNVSDIKHDVQSQLRETRQTRERVQKIAKRLKKLHISGLNNAINSSNIVAVLIATVAFAAIYTVPGQYVEQYTAGASLGEAHIARRQAFIVFFVSDSIALFISLAVVVVQTSVVVIEQKAKRQLVFVINKLMWLACLFISIAFLSIAFVEVGSHGRWLAICATVIGASIMVATISSMCYCVVLHRMEESKLCYVGRGESRSLSASMSVAVSDSEIQNREYKRMFAV